MYLQAAPGMTPYMKVYELDAANANAYNLDAAAGPSVAGAGAFGTFGLNIINNGILWLDTTYSPGTLASYYCPSCVFNDVEMITVSDTTHGKAEGYLDVTGLGLVDNLLDTDCFPFYAPGAPANRADLKMISDLTVQWDPTGGWNNPLWTTNSQDPVTAGVIPEPATMLLVGSGLLGLAGLSRKRFRKS
ncbi:MAG: PEP-CTERM sorting domain-containing protein [Deltaproteobacteria bacterium]|nr:PEP-CTERM sorting domain-containing protein [Deltaproteobacteria bacterium]